MTTPVEKRNHAKFCEFHGKVGHNTDEYMHLRKQIEEMFKAGKLSHLLKELKQNNGKEQPKVTKKGETFGKDKATLRFGLDEFRGCMITISVQRNYWKTMIHKIASSSINSSRNAKVPDGRRSNYLKSSRLVPLECVMVSGPEGAPPATKPIMEERVKVAINPEYPEQRVMIGSTLTKEGRNKLCGLLQRNLDIFAWKPADMTGVPRHITEHRLNMREGCSPVRQKKRGRS
ncbi:hypothetical protein Tco_0619277 [Tanacetum coccineum]